jgi:CAAX protease family protein
MMDTPITATGHSRSYERPRSATTVAWRHVVGFVLLAYGIAWAVWAPAMGDALHAIASGRTPSSYTAPSFAVLGMFAPAIAAVIMRLFVSKEGLKGSLGPVRGKLRWYAVAILGPALFVTATVAIGTVTGISEFTLGVDKPLVYVWLALLLINTPLTAVLTFGEEYGWRGYLLPKLLPLGEVRASAIIALIWAPWHLPLLMVGLNYVNKDPLAVMAFMLLFTLGLSMALTRLFVAAGGSVLVTTFAHASLNAFGDRLSDSAHLSGDPFLVSVGGLLGFALIALVLAAAYGYRRRRSRSDSRSRPLGRTRGPRNASAVAA